MNKSTPQVAEAPGIDIYDISGDTPVLGTIAPEDVEQAISSGNYSFPKEAKVPVVNPNGELGDIDAIEAPQAFQQGYKYATPQVADEANFGTTEQQVAATAEGASQGILGPFAPALEVGLGLSTPERILKRQLVNPGLHAAGELTGFVGGALAGTGEAALIGKIGEGTAAGLGVTSKLGAGILKGAVETMAMSSSDEASRAILNDPGQSMGSVVADIGLSGVLGGGIGAVSPLWQAFKAGPLDAILNLVKSDSETTAANLTNPGGQTPISPVLKKALTTLGGVAPENIDAYILNHEAIKAAPAYEDLYNHALNHIQMINDNLENQKWNLSEAKSSFKDLQNEVSQGFKEQGYDANTAAQAAKSALKDAQQQLASEIQQNAISKAEPVANAVKLLRNQVISGSQDAYNLLEKSGKEISLKPLFEKAKEFQDKIFSQGDPLSLQQADALVKYVETLGSQYGDKAFAPDAKRIIKGLDGLSNYEFNASKFDNGLSPYYGQMRKVLDDTLKSSVPEYAEAMKPIAEKSSLLSDLKGYGTAEDAVKNILKLKSPANYTNDMPLLRDLENNIGIKFTQDLDPYASKVMRQLKINALPEYAAAEKAAQSLEYYKHPATLETLMQSLEHGPEYEEVLNAEKSLEEAKATKENLGPISEASLQSKFNTTMAGKSIANREILKKFPGFEGMSIPEILDLIKVRQAFEKGATNGSRNVNLFRSIGAGVGGALGGLGFGGVGAIGGGAAGGTAGAITGAFIDKEGPALVKKFLDKYVSSISKTAGMSEKSATMGMLNTFGNQAPPNAAAFKASTDYINSVAKGIDLAKKTAKAVFTGGAAILPQYAIPHDDDLKKLDNQLRNLHAHQSQLFDVTGNLGHYMPDHASIVAGTAANAVNLANIERPRNPKQAPLDSEIPISAQQKSEWNRTLSIAEQPLLVMQHIKDGTLLPKDVSTLKALYPDYYGKIAQEMTSAMMEHLSKGETVPYKVRQSMSMFLGEPLDSTFTPSSIQAAQMTFVSKQQQPPNSPVTKNKKNTSKLTGVSKSMQTPSDSREIRRAKA